MAEITTDRPGTTPDVLQHYLTAGIAIETIYANGLLFEKGSRHLLTGLSLDADFPVIAGDAAFAFAGVLPALKPFAALYKPLPDKTVLAIEVAKLAVATSGAGTYNRTGTDARLMWESAYYGPYHNHGGVKVIVDYSEVPEGYEQDDCKVEVIMWPCGIVRVIDTWKAKEAKFYPENLPAIYSLLRSFHIALSLEPHQYVPL